MKISHISYFIALLFLLSKSVSAQNQADEELAMHYYRNGDFEKALSIYSNLFNNGRQLNYYDPYFNTLLKLRQYDEAEKLVKSMSGSKTSPYLYKIDYGRVLQERGQPEKADALYKELIKDLPADEYSIRELAVSFYRASAYDHSVKTLLQGRKLLNDPNAFTFDLLSLYRYQKNKDMLVQEYLNLLGANPEPSLLNQAKAAFSSVFDQPGDYALLKAPLLRKVQKEPQKIVYAELLTWVAIQQKDFAQALKQTIALDKQLKEEGDRVYDLVLLLISNKEYSTAVQGLDYLTGKGRESPYYIPAKVQALQSKYLMLTGGRYTKTDLLKLENDYLALLSEFGRNKNTAFAMRQLAELKAFYLGKPEEAEVLLESVLKIPQLPPPVTAQTKLELGDIYIHTGELWEAALIYGQVEKEFAGEPAGQEAKFRSAKLSYYQGEFAWAKAQLDVLKSSTSQLIANDALNLSLLIAENTATRADTNALIKYAFADRLTFTGKPDEAIRVLDSIDVLYPGNSLSDDILMAKAKIFIKQHDYPKAVENLLAITEHYSYDIWADDALFMLGEIYEINLKDAEKAKEYYQKLITDFPGSLHITEARKRFRNLRGDNLG